MSRRIFPARLAAVIGTALLVSCSADPLAAVLPLNAASRTDQSLHLSYDIEGARLAEREGIAYYLVLDTNGDANDGPMANGPAPISHPAPNIAAFLPFVRSEADILDRRPVVAQDTTWTTYFTLARDNGTWAMWQGRRSPDGTIADRARRLTVGDEWSVQNGRTVQLRVPLSELGTSTQPPAQLEANLIVAARTADGIEAFVLDAWQTDLPTGLALNGRPRSYFTIPANGEPRSESDASPYAGRIPSDGGALNIVRYSARVAPFNESP